MTGFFPIIVLVSLAMVISGCSSITMLRVKELKAVQERVDSLDARTTAVHAQILENQRKQEEILRIIRADQQVRFNELDKQIASLEGNISETQSVLSKIDEVKTEIKRIQEDRTKTDSAGAGRSSEAENLFNIAYGDFNAGRYDLAISGFKDVAARFVQSHFAEDASYWVGECAYAQKDYANAEVAFFGMIKTYPTSKKVCPSLYKLGLIYDGQKKAKSQKMVWDKLLSQCPESEEAKVVKSRGEN